jgi:hypothetical protein
MVEEPGEAGEKKVDRQKSIGKSKEKNEQNG